MGKTHSSKNLDQVGRARAPAPSDSGQECTPLSCSLKASVSLCPARTSCHSPHKPRPVHVMCTWGQPGLERVLVLERNRGMLLF